MKPEIELKTERISKALTAEGFDALLINSQHNFAWLTCGGRNGVDLSRENGSVSLLIRRDGKRFLLANNIETTRILNEELAADDFEPIEYSWQDERSTPTFVIDKALSLLTPGGKLSTDLYYTSSIPVIEGKIAPLRYELSPDERDRFRDLGRDASAAVDRTIERISPGMLETQVAVALEHELGLAKIASVVTLVAADDRISNYRHPVPTSVRWSKTLLIATCAKRLGMIASLSRMICVGDVPDELARKTESAAFVNASLQHATQPGRSGAEIYFAAEKAYTEKGFGDEINRHHQGGAAGYKTREWVAHPKCIEKVMDGQAFAWNPSITGTKVEESYLAHSNGFEAVTSSSLTPLIEHSIGGNVYSSPGIITL